MDRLWSVKSSLGFCSFQFLLDATAVSSNCVFVRRIIRVIMSSGQFLLGIELLEPVWNAHEEFESAVEILSRIQIENDFEWISSAIPSNLMRIHRKFLYILFFAN